MHFAAAVDALPNSIPCCCCLAAFYGGALWHAREDSFRQTTFALCHGSPKWCNGRTFPFHFYKVPLFVLTFYSILLSTSTVSSPLLGVLSLKSAFELDLCFLFLSPLSQNTSISILNLGLKTRSAKNTGELESKFNLLSGPCCLLVENSLRWGWLWDELCLKHWGYENVLWTTDWKRNAWFGAHQNAVRWSWKRSLRLFICIADHYTFLLASVQAVAWKK